MLDAPAGRDSWLGRLLQRIPTTWAAAVVLAAAVAVGWAAHVALSEQADIPNRLNRVDERLAAVESSLTALSQVSGLAVRLRMIEETSCTPEVREAFGADRDRYCDVVAFIRTNGLPDAQARPQNP